jgi:fibronectin-binding autotransporter adhesin
VTVATGATLSGNGTVSRAVNVSGGGSLAPGISQVGTLSIAGDVTLASSSSFRTKVNSALAGNYGQAAVTSGNVALGVGVANLVLDADAYTASTGDMIWIVNNTGAGTTTGYFAGLPADSEVSAGGKKFIIRYDADFDSGSPSGGNDVLLLNAPVGDGMLFEVE